MFLYGLRVDSSLKISSKVAGVGEYIQPSHHTKGWKRNTNHGILSIAKISGRTLVHPSAWKKVWFPLPYSLASTKQPLSITLQLALFWLREQGWARIHCVKGYKEWMHGTWLKRCIQIWGLHLDLINASRWYKMNGPWMKDNVNKNSRTPEEESNTAKAQQITKRIVQ